jgi:hypothetical protein
MLIYKLLGDGAQQEFARSWGISYGLNGAAEWKARRACHDATTAALPALTRPFRCAQDILIESLKGALILALLERLCLTRNSNWLEEVRNRVREAACSPKNAALTLLLRPCGARRRPACARST